MLIIRVEEKPPPEAPPESLKADLLALCQKELHKNRGALPLIVSRRYMIITTSGGSRTNLRSSTASTFSRVKPGASSALSKGQVVGFGAL
jgi:hypothetical protein